MMNYLWSGMILAGILWAAVHGRLDQVTMGALDGAKEAVELGLTMLGILAFWSGILEIAQNAGLVDWLGRRMNPVLKFLFPNLDSEHPAMQYIATNILANMLGLGAAATPAGLAAFRELEKLEEERREEQNGEEHKREGQKRGGQKRERHGRKNEGNGDLCKKSGIVPEGMDEMKRAAGLKRIARPKGTASNEMCTFLILNISSLQLIPVNIIAFRSQYGSSNPATIVGPAIAATLASTLAAVVFCKAMDK